MCYGTICVPIHESSTVVSSLVLTRTIAASGDENAIDGRDDWGRVRENSGKSILSSILQRCFFPKFFYYSKLSTREPGKQKHGMHSFTDSKVLV